MEIPDPAGTDWAHSEIDLVVADYFDMLGMELSGKNYVKSHRNSALRDLTGRSRGSIEFKLQNISAVLQKLGMIWISGYKPRAHYQAGLIDGIDRYLSEHGEPLMGHEFESAPGLADASALFIEPPPTLDASGMPEPEPLRRLVRKFDPAARDARNRELGRRGEERVLIFERSRLIEVGRDDLARKVRWTSQEDGDGAGFDIFSFNQSGDERLLEVKTTSGHQTTPFFLTENERSLSVERPDAFRLVRLYDFARAPKAFELVPPLEHSVLLRPTNYRASFAS